jgi:hypothetical protein
LFAGEPFRKNAVRESVKEKPGAFPVLMAALGVAVLLFAAAAGPRVFPCPLCVDLDYSVFNFHCDLCGGNPRDPRGLSLIGRWKGVRKLEAEGCRRLPLFP